MKKDVRTILQICVLSIVGVGCIIVAFIMGLQQNFYFAAISFLAFFMLGIILLHGVSMVVRKKQEYKQKT